MTKKNNLYYFAILLFLGCFVQAGFASAKPADLSEQLAGKILLQVESYGRAWYVYPGNHLRYYMQDGPSAYFIMRELSLGITNEDLAKIPTRKGQIYDAKLVNRLKGWILLQVEKNGEAWYVNPGDGLRYYLKDGDAAYEIMRKFSLGISDDNLKLIPMNSSQIVHDTTFSDVAYVKYDGTNYAYGYHDNQILPLASMTKLMTALVLSDLGLDWEKELIITQEQIDYPGLFTDGEKTSEIDCRAGDRIKIKDLWISMLLASSNQAAVALADSTGLTRQKFVSLMNQKAVSLGLSKTLFYDVSGLDAHNVTTPREMAKIAKAAFAIKEIADNTVLTDYAFSAFDRSGQQKEISVRNRNYSLLAYEPEATKTGYLIEAQRTAALKKNGSIIVIMHAYSMSQRNTIIEQLLSQ